MNEENVIDSICAIIVTYNPDDKIYDRILLIYNQVDKVVIIDNNSSIECKRELIKISNKLNIHLILNEENLGIARALNQGINYAIKNKYKWILTLDQDSIVDKDLVKNLKLTYKFYPDKNKVGIIGTNFIDKNTGLKYRMISSATKNWLEVDEVISSGSLYPVTLFNTVGYFREDLFIDQVDNEFCLRVRLNGYKIILSTYIGMLHSMGNMSKHKFFNKQIVCYNYSPLRYYYRTRNRILLAKEYFRKDIIWSLNRVIISVKEFLKVLLYENNKKEKIKFMLLGFLHAILSKYGSIDKNRLTVILK